MLGREEPLEYVFLAIMLLVTGIFYLESLGLEEESVIVPRIFIVGTVLFIVLKLLSPWLGFLADRLGLRKDSEQVEQEEQFDINEELEEVDMPELHPRGAVVTMVWMIAYVVAIESIGFFSSSFLFMLLFGYIYTERESQGRIRRLGTSALWGIALSLFAYYLFIELLRATSIIRLGPIF